MSDTDGLNLRAEDMAELLGGAGWVLAGTAFGLTFSFFAQAIPARLLGAQKYGILILGFTIVSLFRFLSSLGLPQGITRYVPRYDDIEEQRHIVLTGFVLATLTSTVLVAGILVFSEAIAVEVFDEPRLTAVLRILAMLLLLITYKQLFVSVFRALSMTRERVLIQDVLFPVSKFVFISGAVVVGFGLTGAATGFLFAGVLSVAASAYLLYSRTDLFPKFEPSKMRTREILAFSAPLVISSAYGTVLNYGDTFLAGLFLSSASVGIYQISYIIAKLQTSVLAAFGFLFFPLFSRFESNGEIEKLIEFTKLVTKMMVFLTVPVYLTIVLFPEQILSLFGQDYTTGSDVLILLATGILFHTVLGLTGQALMSFGYTKVVMVISSVSAVMNLVLNFYLIPVYGLLGAAFASALAYSSTMGVFTVVLYRWEDIHPFSKGLWTILGFTGLLIILHYPLRYTLSDFPVWTVPLLTALITLTELLFYLSLNGIESGDQIILNLLKNWFGKIKIR